MDTFVEVLLKAIKLYSLGMLKVQLPEMLEHIFIWTSFMLQSKTVQEEEIRLYFKTYMSKIMESHPELEEELYKLIRIFKVLENG